MDPIQERLLKLREERQAREKARIDKLRELNLKKYGKPDGTTKSNASNSSLIKQSVKSYTNMANISQHIKQYPTASGKNNFHAEEANRLIPGPVKDIKSSHIAKNNSNYEVKPPNIVEKKISDTVLTKKLFGGSTTQKIHNDKLSKDRRVILTNPVTKVDNISLNGNSTRKSIVTNNLSHKNFLTGKSNFNKTNQTSYKLTVNNDSVFERLYKPKITQKKYVSDVEKLKSDPNYLKKVIQTTGLIINKHILVGEQPKPKIKVPVRRSISAVHLKRISKQELGNCIHKCSSIGDKLNNIHLKHVNEDESIKEDKVVSAVKSERKKVTFMTPVNFNTPRPEELQSRLKAWLQKRGKSLDSYQHLQCFGINHLPCNRFDNRDYDDENKENIALESDSDNDSYTENMESVNKWRTTTVVSDSVDFNESQNTTSTYSDAMNIDDIVIGALNDLTELLHEGFAWEQCARWLRAIRERFPSARRSAAYWECRAALEERRGDLPASVQCWEEAIAKGTEQSVVEANLDQLLDKFMQLKISPNSGKSGQQVDSKLIDVKNVFKSTIIRFAVQQAKLRQSNQCSPLPKFCVTPVRRSGRLSSHWTGNDTLVTQGSIGKRTPLQVCSSVRQAGQLIGEELQFVPNDNLYGTP